MLTARYGLVFIYSDSTKESLGAITLCNAVAQWMSMWRVFALFPYVRLMFLANREYIFFNFDYSQLPPRLNYVTSLLFPAKHFAYFFREQTNKLAEKYSFEDILSFNYVADVVIVSYFITSQLAIFASLLSGSRRVLLIAPIYETPNGLQEIPEQYLGARKYSGHHFFDCGIHRASNTNLETVLLHNFDYFTCSQPLVFNTLQRYVTSHDYGYAFYPNNGLYLGGHNFAMQSRLLANFVQSLNIGRYNYPRMLVSTGGCSGLAAAALYRYFFLNGLQTRPKNEILEPRRTRVIGWLYDYEFSSYDICGICGVNASELESLYLQVDNWIDPYNSRLFSARGMLLYFERLFCTEFVANLLRNKQELAWCCRNLSVIKENLLGIMYFYTEVLPLLTS